LVIYKDSANTVWILMRFVIWEYLKKSVGNIQALLKSDKNKGYFTGDHYTFLIISRSVLLRLKNVADKSCRETQSTHFMFSNIYSKIMLFMRFMLKNIVERGRPQMTIWLVRNACWIPKATETHTHTYTHTHTHRLCNTHCFSTTTMVARTRLIVTLCVRCLSC